MMFRTRRFDDKLISKDLINKLIVVMFKIDLTMEETNQNNLESPEISDIEISIYVVDYQRKVKF